MNPISIRDRDFFLAVRLLDENGLHLVAMDLLTGQKLVELSESDPDRDLPLGAILILQDAVIPPRKGPGGGLVLSGTFFWSILDPLAARLPFEDPWFTRLAAEDELRSARDRFLNRLRWWRALDPTF